MLGQQRGIVEGRADGNHQLKRARDRSQRGDGGPGVERRGFRTLDVVHMELGDKREVIAESLSPDGEIANILPGGGHALIVDVAKPAAEDG